jgi:acetyl esterase/lipase
MSIQPRLYATSFCFGIVLVTAAVLVLSFGFCSADEQADQLAEAMKIVETTDPYTHFITLEDELIADQDAEYLAAREAYLLGNYVTNRLDQNPRKTLPVFMQAIEEKFVEGADKGRFSDAAWNAGMMLLEDHPSFEVPLEGLDIRKGIVFAENPELDMELDLFLPAERGEDPIPCIVCIHGGGWRVHRRAWFNGHAAYFASKGYAAVSIDYRMFPAIETPIPCVEDCKAAVRWIRANADEYGIDPNRIGAVGGSAGAHLTAMLAVSSAVRELEGPGGNADYSSAIQAGVGYATPVFNATTESGQAAAQRWNFGDNLKLVSPYANVDENSAPLLLIHGTSDGTVPFENSVEMHAKYQSVGADSELMPLEGKGHVFYTAEEAAGWAFDFFQSRFEPVE